MYIVSLMCRVGMLLYTRYNSYFKYYFPAFKISYLFQAAPTKKADARNKKKKK